MTRPDATDEHVATPRHLVVLLGTSTEVGKTWVAARLVEALRRQAITVNVRKPVQSYDPASSEPTDAEVLGAASGESPEVVCAADHSFGLAMAPPMAAEVLGVDIPTVAEVVAGLRWTDGIDLGIVETVGGVRSPLCADGDSRQLALALGADVTVLVADAGLGVVDAVRKSVDSLAPVSPLVFLNRYDAHDDLHRANRAWLTEHDGINVSVAIDSLAKEVRRQVHRPA